MTQRTKYIAEYLINSSPEFLFSYISTPSGLAIWFADDVTLNGDIYTFKWEGSEERAKFLSKRYGKSVRFQWIDRPDPEVFTFEIVVDELTNDVALVISDYENEDDVDGSRAIYDVCVERLRHTIGG